MASWPPAVSDFEAYFAREFVYGDTDATVMDSDVQRALDEAAMVFNSSLWGSAAEKNVAYLYVAAHFLALNIQGAGGLSTTNNGRGVQSAGGGAIESKSVGGVSVSYALPDIVRQSPILSQFMRTDFGQKYLALITPRLVGNVMLVSGMDGCLPLQPLVSSLNVGGTTLGQLKVTTLTLPAGVVAVAYSQTFLGEGGLAPLRWTLTDGTLPTGLSLSTAGVLSGTPTVAGTYFFTITLTDARGNTATQSFEVTIS